MSMPELARPGTGRGLLITFEGLDGVGKSTQLSLVGRALAESGHDVVCLREPGGTCLGEDIREALLHGEADICPMAELLLFEAARAQLVQDVIVPALARGATVLCDRFFDSTVAYQGFGRELGVDAVRAANSLACASLEPDATLLFDMDPKDAIARATRRGTDRMEGEDAAFRDRVRHGFLTLAEEHPSRILVIAAAGTVEQVWQRVRSSLAHLLALPALPPVPERG